MSSLYNLECAVEVKNMNFTYPSSASTLRSVSMAVPTGSVYALIGPSGCGKTTLLKIILGLLQPRSGMVTIFGYKPGEFGSDIPGRGVGYMPQEYALYRTLTIKEILVYYGRINGLGANVAKREANMIRERLRLPPENRLICTLSGGEKRRVSFAVAALHNPRLLILDEPTVGMDPLLRFEVWEWIRSLAAKKATVIVTTHYVDEAKADTIAFMRQGQILAEMPPKTLLDTFGKKSLQDVFLVLGQQQMESSKWSRRESNLPQQVVRSEAKSKNRAAISSASIVFLLMKRILMNTLRDPGAMILLVVFQVIGVTVNDYCVQRDPREVPLGVIFDSKEYDIIQNDSFFNVWSNLTVHDKVTTGSSNLPLLFLSLVDTNIVTMVKYENLDSALLDIKKRTIAGALYFPPTFSKYYPLREFLWLTGEDDLQGVYNASEVPTFYKGIFGPIVDEVMTYVLEKTTFQFRAEAASLYEVRPELLKPPIMIEEVIVGKQYENQLFSNRLFTAGYIVVVIYCLVFGVSAACTVIELEDCSLVREYSCGVQSHQLVIARIVALSLPSSFSVLTLVVVVQYVLNIHFEAQFLRTLLYLLLVMVVAVTQGVLLAHVIPNYTAALYVGLFVTFLIFATSGYVSPLESLPYYVRTLVAPLPYARMVKAMFTLMNHSNLVIYGNVFSSAAELFVWFLFFAYWRRARQFCFRK